MGIKAKTNNPSTFTIFETAMESAAKFDGIGLGIFGGILPLILTTALMKMGTFRSWLKVLSQYLMVII